MKKMTGKKRTAKKSKGTAAKGNRFTCSECGFSVIVEEPCECADCHQLVCCGAPMACSM